MSFAAGHKADVCMADNNNEICAACAASAPEPLAAIFARLQAPVAQFLHVVTSAAEAEAPAPGTPRSGARGAAAAAQPAAEGMRMGFGFGVGVQGSEGGYIVKEFFCLY